MSPSAPTERPVPVALAGALTIAFSAILVRLADVSPETVERLRAGNILYDSEAEGEYFQVYTRTLEGGFFFEIVQRRAYRGFGAVNAPIRLASQTRLAPSKTLPAH